MVGEAITDPTTIGVRSHIPIGAGEVPRVAGVIHSQSSADLAPSSLGRGLFPEGGHRDSENLPAIIQRIALAVSDLLRVRLRVSVVSVARVALR